MFIHHIRVYAITGLEEYRLHVHVSSDSCIMIIGFCFPDNLQVVYQCFTNAVSLSSPESKSILFILGAWSAESLLIHLNFTLDYSLHGHEKNNLG